MRRIGFGVFGALAVCSGGFAQEVVVGVSSSVEAGWTSNASDTLNGAADRFIEHAHGIEIGVGGDGVALRGSLDFTQIRFEETDYEADDAVALELEGDVLRAPGMQLRVGYRIDQAWTGDEIDLGVIVLPFRTTETRQEIGAELVVALGPGALSVGASWEGVGNGLAKFADDIIAPVRLSADAEMVTGRLAWEADLGQGVALLAEATGRIVTISDADREAFGLLPAHGLQVAAGLSSQSANATALRVLAGFDVVLPEGRSDLVRVAPFADAVFSSAITPEFGIALEAGLAVERLEPVDGVASRMARLGAGATYAIADDAELFANLTGAREVGIFGSDLSLTELTIRTGLVVRPTPELTARIAIERRERFDGFATITADSVSLGLDADL